MVQNSKLSCLPGERSGFGGKYFLLLVLVFIGACNTGNPKFSSGLLIHGSMQNASGKTIYLYAYADTFSRYLALKTAIDSSVVGENGKFAFHFSSQTPQVIDLEISGRNLVSNLFMTSGDELELDFAGEGNSPEILSSGQASRLNSFLLQMADTFYKEPVMRRAYYILTNYMELPQFTSYCDDRMQKQLDFFHRFFKNETLKKEFSDYAIQTITYGIGCDKLMFLWKKRMKGERVIADSSWFDFITPAYLENKDAFYCPAYIRFLNLYIKDYYERLQEKRELPVGESKPPVPALEKYNLARQLLNRPYRDVVLVNIITDEMHHVSDTTRTTTYRSSIPLDSMILWFNQKYPGN